MDQRRLMLAIILSMGVIFVWPMLFPPPQPVAPEPVELSEEAPDRAGEAAVAQEPGAGEPTADPAPEAQALETVEAEREERWTVETATFVATLTNRGGNLESVRLHGFEGDDGADVELVRRRVDTPSPFAFVDPRGRALEIDEALYVGEQRVLEDGTTEVAFRYRGTRGAAEKVYVFGQNGRFELQARLGAGEGVGRGDWGILVGPGIQNPSAAKIGQAQFWRGATVSLTDDLERQPAAKVKKVQAFAGRSVRWAALDDSYFLTALLPQEGVSEVLLVPYFDGVAARALSAEDNAPAESAEDKNALPPPAEWIPFRTAEEITKVERDAPREMALVALASGERMSLDNYWGTKTYGDLKSMGLGLEQTVDFGWFTFFARPLQAGLKYVYENWVHNYGWAIVLMTIGIKLLLLPITHHSMKSMQKMQEVSPKVQAIQAKWRPKLKNKQGGPNLEARQKMQQEVMETYRAAGANPASGCLPMVAQIPVFIAFYQVLAKAIELRGAPWIGWITDLSLADPYYVLPIVMFGTQLLQQMRMPMGGDPMQRKLFLFMPFIFLIFFLKFPAGMVLYWLTNNVLSILQQEYYRHQREKASAAEAKAPKGGKAESKGKA